MAFPGGAGYGDPLKRDLDQVRLDLKKGYISLEYALKFYDFSIEELQMYVEKIEEY
jgi:N-methylhydantoinase B